MNIVIYSSNLYKFDGNSFHYKNIPSTSEFWKTIVTLFPSVKLTFVSQLPSLFLFDLENETLINKVESINYVVLKSTKDFVPSISSLSPDLCIAFSFWTNGMDLLSVNDSLIGEELKNKGFNVICHSCKTSMLCADKYEFSLFLKNHDFSCPPSIFVNHSLFLCEKSRNDITFNSYKAYIYKKVSELQFPVIIKDQFGLSSFGMEVLNTFGEVKNFLESKRFNSDRIIEKYIQGYHFGLEIWGNKNNYWISNPFMFSLNKFGITSPKQSVKAGPVTSDFFKIDSLKTQIKKLISELNLNGFAQVDLIFDGNNWFIVEVNSRLSGMTRLNLCSISQNSAFKSFIEKFIASEENNFEKEVFFETSPVLSIKFEPLSDKEMQNLSSLPYVLSVNQIQNDEAKQKRETGFCEVIIGNKGNDQINLKAALQDLKEKAPFLEEVFFNNAVKLLSDSRL